MSRQSHRCATLLWGQPPVASPDERHAACMAYTKGNYQGGGGGARGAWRWQKQCGTRRIVSYLLEQCCCAPELLLHANKP
jgi:hypothetical protein